MIDEKIELGLNPLPHDDRDFVFGTVFGDTPLEELPKTFFVEAFVQVKNQYNSDFCTEYGATAVSEDQELVALNPEYSIMKARELGNIPLSQWGIDLRTACEPHVKIGALEQSLYPHLDKRPDHDREFLLNPANWDKDLDMHAFDHKKNSYFRVDLGGYDVFDNIRSALWANKSANASVLTGSMWRPGWTTSPKGVIPKEAKTGGGGHAFKVFGWNEIGLVAQLSNGDDIGDKGVFYFPRAVVNREFVFGAFMFTDMPKEEAEHLNHNKIKVDDKKMIRLLKVIRQLLIDIIKLKQKTS